MAKEDYITQKQYEISRKWIEMKDCTFKPKINRKNTFHQKRNSNSCIGLRSILEDKKQVIDFNTPSVIISENENDNN